MKLKVGNGFTVDLPGLGKIKPLEDLSQKRITKATREALRHKYGYQKKQVSCQVSCSATFTPATWWGKCRVKGIQYDYEISN